MNDRPLVATALALALACAAPTPAAAQVVPRQPGHIVGGLAWLDQAPAASPLGSLRCDDPSFAELGPGLTAAHRPDLQQVHLVSSGIPANLSTAGVEKAVWAALNTWNEEVNDCRRPDGSTFSFRYVGLLNMIPLPNPDEFHTVLFGAGLCRSSLHVACMHPHTDPATGGLEGWDIVLDPTYPWGTTQGPWLDVQAVLTHEFGHVVGLADMGRRSAGCATDHVWLSMYACTWPGDTVKRTLALGDALGVEAMSHG